MEQFNAIPEGLSVVKFTEQEMAEMHEMMDKVDYRCGDDGWIPTLRDVDEKIIGRYYAKVREKLNVAITAAPDSRKRLAELDAELKRMWFFMYWIVDTCPDMDPVAYERLMKFVDSKHEIVR